MILLINKLFANVKRSIFFIKPSLFEFYGISIFVGYLMPNPFLYK